MTAILLAGGVLRVPAATVLPDGTHVDGTRDITPRGARLSGVAAARDRREGVLARRPRRRGHPAPLALIRRLTLRSSP
ncbi:hypothetical protein [Nonomuraea salmonea]|uniref:hypothetical protein n=1 Tax=Nonomuraea salmonea TaxID=46181 RepID=UPI0031ED26E4